MLKKMNLKKKLKLISLIFFKLIDDILLAIGITLLAIGVFKIYIPAGYIVLGICVIAFAFLIVKRGG